MKWGGWGFFLKKNITKVLSFLPFVGMAMDFPDLLERLLGTIRFPDPTGRLIKL